MAQITVVLPSLLATLAGERSIPVDADTVAHALDLLTARHPAIGQAIFNEAGVLREHVLCFHNNDNTRWHAEGLHQVVQAGDRLTLLQAVAGG